MANRLAGKVALISGAARGLGAADARLFVMEGAKVVLGDVLDKKGQELAKELNQGAKTGPVVYVHLDVTKATDWENAVVAAEREFGRDGGCPAVFREVRDLIRRMSLANPRWGAPRIHGELLKLGIEVSQATVAEYMVRTRKPPSQTWRTFLENHVKSLV